MITGDDLYYVITQYRYCKVKDDNWRQIVVTSNYIIVYYLLHCELKNHLDILELEKTIDDVSIYKVVLHLPAKGGV
jgi:hypothetical protein